MSVRSAVRDRQTDRITHDAKLLHPSLTLGVKTILPRADHGTWLYVPIYHGTEIKMLRVKLLA